MDSTASVTSEIISTYFLVKDEFIVQTHYVKMQIKYLKFMLTHYRVANVKDSTTTRKSISFVSLNSVRSGW